MKKCCQQSADQARVEGVKEGILIANSTKKSDFAPHPEVKVRRLDIFEEIYPVQCKAIREQTRKEAIVDCVKHQLTTRTDERAKVLKEVKARLDKELKEHDRCPKRIKQDCIRIFKIRYKYAWKELEQTVSPEKAKHRADSRTTAGKQAKKR